MLPTSFVCLVTITLAAGKAVELPSFGAFDVRQATNPKRRQSANSRSMAIWASKATLKPRLVERAWLQAKVWALTVR